MRDDRYGIRDQRTRRWNIDHCLFKLSISIKNHDYNGLLVVAFTTLLDTKPYSFLNSEKKMNPYGIH